MKKPSVVLVLISGLMAHGCNSAQDDLYRHLQSIEVGKAIPLSRVFSSDVTTVCLIGPYARVGIPSQVSHTVGQHEYLDEGSWGIVVKRKGKLEKHIYPRSEELNWSEVDRVPYDLPKTLLRTQCASLHQGIIIRFRQDDREYIELAKAGG